MLRWGVATSASCRVCTSWAVQPQRLVHACVVSVSAWVEDSGNRPSVCRGRGCGVIEADGSVSILSLSPICPLHTLHTHPQTVPPSHRIHPFSPLWAWALPMAKQLRMESLQAGSPGRVLPAQPASGASTVEPANQERVTEALVTGGQCFQARTGQLYNVWGPVSSESGEPTAGNMKNLGTATAELGGS